MNPEDLTTEYILSEVKKLQYLYGLKYEIRYAQKRSNDIFTESVAEHIYGMHVCALYFTPLENAGGSWNLSRIYEMITLHDIDELETGDMLGYLKTDSIRDREHEAKLKVINKLPTHLKENFESITEEYEAQETVESRFVKALDRFEPLLQMYSEFGHHVIRTNQTKEEDARVIKEKYIKPYPTMYKYYRTIHQKMIDEGYFHI